MQDHSVRMNGDLPNGDVKSQVPTENGINGNHDNHMGSADGSEDTTDEPMSPCKTTYSNAVKNAQEITAEGWCSEAEKSNPEN